MAQIQASAEVTTITYPGVDAAHTGYARLRSTDTHRQRIDCFVRHTAIDLGRGTGDAGARVALGENQAISRQHARIAWNAQADDGGVWELTVQSKNGASVDGAPVSPVSAPVPLRSRTSITIADRTLTWHGPAPGWPVLTGDGNVVVQGAGVE